MPQLQNVVFYKWDLEVVLVQALEGFYGDRLETIAKRCHDPHRVARKQDYFLLMTEFRQEFKILKFIVINFYEVFWVQNKVELSLVFLTYIAVLNSAH